MTEEFGPAEKARGYACLIEWFAEDDTAMDIARALRERADALDACQKECDRLRTLLEELQ